MSRPFGPSDQLVAAVDQLIYSGAVRYQNPARVRDDVLSICPQIPSLLPRSGLLPSGGTPIPFSADSLQQAGEFMNDRLFLNWYDYHRPKI